MPILSESCRPPWAALPHGRSPRSARRRGSPRKRPSPEACATEHIRQKCERIPRPTFEQAPCRNASAARRRVERVNCPLKQHPGTTSCPVSNRREAEIPATLASRIGNIYEPLPPSAMHPSIGIIACGAATRSPHPIPGVLACGLLAAERSYLSQSRSTNESLEPRAMAGDGDDACVDVARGLDEPRPKARRLLLVSREQRALDRLGLARQCVGARCPPDRTRDSQCEGGEQKRIAGQSFARGNNRRRDRRERLARAPRSGDRQRRESPTRPMRCRFVSGACANRPSVPSRPQEANRPKYRRSARAADPTIAATDVITTIAVPRDRNFGRLGPLTPASETSPRRPAARSTARSPAAADG